MFGQELSELSFALSLLISFTAGILSFLSPCVLPIVPPYLAFMAGTSISNIENSKLFSSRTSWLFAISACFVVGLSTVFIILGLAAAAVGSLFFEFRKEINYLAGILVIIFGLHFLGIMRIPVFMREYRFNLGSGGGGLTGAYVLGVAFAFGWTPCIGPVLGAILAMSAQAESLGRGASLMATYAVGLGCPFILSGVFFGRAFEIFAPLRRNAVRVEKVTGLLLLTVGILLITGAFTSISFWLLEYVPFLSWFG